MSHGGYQPGGYYTIPKANELTFSQEQERTRELRALQGGATVTRVSSGATSELSEPQRAAGAIVGKDWVLGKRQESLSRGGKNGAVTRRSRTRPKGNQRDAHV